MPVNPTSVRRALIAVAALLASATGAPTALAADARYEGISADGDVAFFSTVDAIVPGDTDTKRDIYERSYDEAVEGFVTRHVSFGPTGGNNAFDAQFQAVTADGVRAFFSTRERLSSEDKDIANDIYVRDLVANTTKLVSAGDPSCAGSGCGNANSAVSAVAGGVVDGGSIVFFASEERLAVADADEFADVYARDLQAGTTTLVSEGASACQASGCGDGPAPAFFQGASTDGTTVFFTSAEALRTGDSDTLGDIYERDLDAGETRLVSTPGTCPAELNCTPVYGGASADGSHVFFETNERISGIDTDSKQDVYDWSAETASLASRGPSGFNGAFNALYAGSSSDGSAVFVATDEKLDVGADTDEAQDVYVRADGTSTAIVSAGDPACLPTCGNGDFPATLRWVSPGGDVAFLSTAESLLADDADSAFDLYRRDLPGGPTELVSRPGPACTDPACGNGPHDANFAGASADGSRIFFITTESLVPPDPGDPLAPGDKDGRTDVYERAAGTTTLISVGSMNGNLQYDAQLQGVSTSGARAFFVTKERLTGEDDVAGEEDVYSRSASGTLLVSAENDPELELGPPPPVLESTDPPSPGSSTEPRIVGSEAEAAAAIKIYASADCSGEPVAIGSAEELAEPGLQVTVTAGSTTSFRATAEAEGFISTCSNALTYKQQDSTPPPPPGGGSGGGSPGGSSGGGDTGTDTGSDKTHSGGIAYVTPVTRITFGPASKTRARRPVFRFTDATGQPGTRFLCKVDRRSWRGCGSPIRLQRLNPGRHVFSVRAVNAAGTSEPRPSKRAFKVVPR